MAKATNVYLAEKPVASKTVSGMKLAPITQQINITKWKKLQAKNDELSKSLKREQAENVRLRQYNTGLRMELDRLKRKVMGFTLQKKKCGNVELWYAWKVIDGSTRYVYVGKDTSRAKEKILAWLEKYDLMYLVKL